MHSWVTLLHSAAWGFSLSWAAAATKQLLSDAVFQNKQTDQVWWPPRPNCANAGVLKFGVVYSFSPLLAPWLLFFSLHFPFILSQLSNDVQIQLNLSDLLRISLSPMTFAWFLSLCTPVEAWKSNCQQLSLLDFLVGVTPVCSDHRSRKVLIFDRKFT